MATLVLVLVVLPRRYVLSSGFRESGVSFPTTAPPFEPAEMVRRAAPILPPEPEESQTTGDPGPAELLWTRVISMLDAGLDTRALSLFEQYLAEYPGDTDVLREYAVTLLSAGRAAEATEVLQELLDRRGTDQTRLLLARTLRDLGRREEAADLYRTLWQRDGDPEVALEWSRSWSWVEEYGAAIAVLDGALDERPAASVLQVELARLLYFTDELQRAKRILDALDPATRSRLDATDLRERVIVGLTEPEPEVTTPTLAERAAAARVAGDVREAAELYRQALEDTPSDPGLWQEYADLLQYEVEDLRGARNALLEVEDLLADPGADLLYRIAQLEIWTGMNAAAEDRIMALLAELANRPDRVRADSNDVAVPELMAVLGDLDRWADRRVEAARHYRTALSIDPGQARASTGLEALEALRTGLIDEFEKPGVDLEASTLSDSDDFSRVDLTGHWVTTRGVWAWRVEAGHRWLEGRDPVGSGSELQGAIGSVEFARWWRWATMRTALRLGLDDVGTAPAEPQVGVSATILPASGGSVEFRYHHGPAYPLTTTLQTAITGYTSDELALTANLPIEACWDLTLQLQTAWLRPDRSLAPDATTRLSAAAILARSLGSSLDVGLELRALHFTRAAPILDGGGLFWDPDVAVSVLPFLRLERPFAAGWTARGRLAAGGALLNERRTDGTDLVPQFAVEAGLGYRGERIGGSLDLFHRQGRFDGYRSWGLRLGLSVPTSSGPEGGS